MMIAIRQSPLMIDLIRKMFIYISVRISPPVLVSCSSKLKSVAGFAQNRRENCSSTMSRVTYLLQNLQSSVGSSESSAFSLQLIRNSMPQTALGEITPFPKPPCDLVGLNKWNVRVYIDVH